MSADGQTCRLIADGTAVPNNDPLPMVAGKRTASPHIASGWKRCSTESEPNEVSVSLLGSNALALAAGASRRL
ncbi:MAG: hypothetical protein LBQ54_12485 [Planctomycetaceae bacterium]|nr:hypothetical protein [Planctomycetaceae bacterium]